MDYLFGVSDSEYPELLCIDFPLTFLFSPLAEAKIDTEQT